MSLSSRPAALLGIPVRLVTHAFRVENSCLLCELLSTGRCPFKRLEAQCINPTFFETVLSVMTALEARHLTVRRIA